MSILDSYGGAAIVLPPSAPARGHQRSRTTIDLPLFTRSTSRSPTRASNLMPFGHKACDTSPNPSTSTGSIRSGTLSAEAQRKVKSGTVGKIASWFEGDSEPVNITLIPSPRKEKPDPFYQLDHSANGTRESSLDMDNLTQRSQNKHSSSQSLANSSMFNFFKRNTVDTPKTDPNTLVQLDIRQALLPDGPVQEVSSAAYKALQLSAESLLRRFQVAYAENLEALREAVAEKRVQAEELEAANTRNEHLKLQLLETAEKAAEQEKMIASLKQQLSVPQPSIRMIHEDDYYKPSRGTHRNRISDVSATDESFVDSEASSVVSVFSDVESIRTPSSSVGASPNMKYASLYSPQMAHSYQAQPQATPVIVPQCQNCHNVPASEAWDVIEMMRMESAGLKERITELESAHDSALDFLTTLKM